MSGNLRGLRSRIGRAALRVAAQHQKIESRYAIIARAMNSGATREARATLLGLHQSLDAHFCFEEGVFFPALKTFCPTLRDELAALVSQHERFRNEMVQIRKRLDAGELDASAARFDTLATELARHDDREERLVTRILGRVAPSNCVIGSETNASRACTSRPPNSGSPATGRSFTSAIRSNCRAAPHIE